MKRLIQLIAILLLLAAPPLAANQVTVPAQKDSLDALQSTFVALIAATSAQVAEPEDADLASALDEARLAYDKALGDARELRDESGEGNDGELGIAIFAITGDGLDVSGAALTGMVEGWIDQARTWVTDKGPGLLINVLIALLILLVFRVFSKIAGKITAKALSSSKLKVSDLLKKFFVGSVQKLIFFIGVMIALERVGVNTAPLLAGIGVVGFVIGFALQDTLSNFASGIMILLYRPYDIGDFITAAGESGSVKDMSLVSTTMTTGDNQKLIIPNSAIWGGTIRNVTAQKTRRVDLVIGVGYGDDLDKAEEVLLEIISAHAKVLKDPAPLVRVSNLGDSSVDFVVRPWTKTSDYWEVLWDLTKTIKQRLDQEGISIPYPQRDLHVVEIPEGLAKSS